VRCDMPIAVAAERPADARSPSPTSPNGLDRLVELRREQWDLWIFRESTGQWWQLTNDANYEFDPDWSPDGTWITYVKTMGQDSEILIERDPRTVAVAPTSLSRVKVLYR